MTDRPEPPSSFPQRPAALRAVDRLAGLATFVTIVAWIGGAASVLVGVLLAVKADHSCADVTCYATVTTHPYLSDGFTLVISGIIEAVLLSLIAQMATVLGDLRKAQIVQLHGS